MIGANFNPDLCRHVMSQLLWVNGSTGKSALCTPFIFLNWQLYIQVPRDLATHRWTVLIIARGYPKFHQTIWLTCVKSCSELLTVWKTFKKLNPVYSVVDIVHVGGLEEYAGESVSVWRSLGPCVTHGSAMTFLCQWNYYYYCINMESTAECVSYVCLNSNLQRL